ncbi:MAG: ATP-dependent DNA helicase [Flavobacteriales bacterium]
MRKDLENNILELLPFTPTEEQSYLIKKVSRFCLKENSLDIFVLNGYAGTGKTSLLGALSKSFLNFRQKFVLLAPTGRAAKVLQSKTKCFTSTIHKHIYQSKVDSGGFTSFHRKPNKTKNTIYIVDESSMIHSKKIDSEGIKGTSVLDDLIGFVFSGEGNKLILVGDTAQLPPVNLERSIALDPEELQHAFWKNVDHFTLSDVKRQKENSDILWSATSVRETINGEEDTQVPQLKDNSAECIRHQDRYELEYALDNAMDVNGTDETVVICRSNKRANQYNQRIRQHFYGRESEIERGDHIMIVKNNYFWVNQDSDAGFLANGEMAHVERIVRFVSEYGYRFVELELKLVDYPNMKPFVAMAYVDTLYNDSASLSFQETQKLYYQLLEEYSEIPTKRKRFERIKQNPYFNALQIKFAYALTCHKSQGGQWDEVFIEQPYWDLKNMNNSDYKWLYTAITRASKKVHLIGFDPKFFIENETKHS